jgi:RES domain-containing protein
MCYFTIILDVKTALETAIKEACGLSTNIQQTAQKHYTDIVELMTESGLKCSVSDEIAIKTDIISIFSVDTITRSTKMKGI